MDSRYIVEGRGTPCVVIGSLTYYPRTFSQELRSHFKFVFVDSRHFSPPDTSLAVDEITIDTYCDDVEQLRGKLGLDRIAVLGHSIHGSLALEYARRYPEHTSHVIAIASPPCGMTKVTAASGAYWEAEASEERKRIWNRNWKELGPDALSKMPPAEAFVKMYVTNGPMYWYEPTYDASWLWEGVETNVEVFGRLMGVLFAEYDLAQGPGQITSPVFLALGRHDYVVPYSLWDDEKDKLLNVPLSYNLFERSGHTPQLEEQALFDQRLVEWIGR